LSSPINGWPEHKIARDLTMHLPAVFHQMKAIFKQNGVKNRHELAKKLGSPHPQPLTRSEKAAPRRARVRELVAAGLTHQQIIAQLDCNRAVYFSDLKHVLRAEGVKTREDLFEKHGIGRKDPARI
jgi:DNA-binding CsgD family transcriptional regulator